MSVKVQTTYPWLDTLAEQLQMRPYFLRNGLTIHSGRNTLKVFEADGRTVVVKSYDRLSSFNRLIYGWLRRSKAERAYRNAARLHSLGIDTPEGLGFVDIRRRGMLVASYFIASYSDYRPIAEAVNNFPCNPCSREIIDALAKFLVHLHWAGILHEDLNVGNILYKEDGSGGYLFQIIDTNRMSFHRQLSIRRRVDNLRRLSCNTPPFVHLLGRYAELLDVNPDVLQLKGVFSRLLFEVRQRMKRRMKSMKEALLAVVVLCMMALMCISCDVEYHPYDTRTESPTGMNAANISLIERQTADEFHLTFTLRQNCIQWSVRLCESLRFEPFACGIYFNWISGHDYWF